MKGALELLEGSRDYVSGMVVAGVTGRIAPGVLKVYPDSSPMEAAVDADILRVRKGRKGARFSARLMAAGTGASTRSAPRV
ncbi:hypothetical protein Nepgr_030695 [Nepenthes gracilis]|uniref:Uncharacterized protein n=1 Tax=Nepenthes gracilis TaxID=150966 RepID=A0AAD3TG80_NEPGR|nr:hypothetical protein Nepgr_030695 [Nepenthes gracilis]